MGKAGEERVGTGTWYCKVGNDGEALAGGDAPVGDAVSMSL